VCPARMNTSACRRPKQSSWLRHRAHRCRGQNVPLSDRRNVAILVVQEATTREPVARECGHLVADSRMLPDVVDLGLCPFAVPGGDAMRQDQAATLLRAYGFDVRTDGLGNVAARVCVKRSDGTIGFEWRPVPADSSAEVMRWIAAL
jgi:hypothetical protein